MEARGLARIYWVPVDPKEAEKQFNIDTPYLADEQEFYTLCNEEQHDNNAPPE